MGYEIDVVDENGKNVDCDIKEFEDNYLDISLKGVVNGSKIKIIFKAK